MARDFAYETLAEVTATDQNVGRGALNAALKQIKEQAAHDDIFDNYELSLEISTRARMYHQVFPGIAITPTALAKHWVRVKVETAKQRVGANLHADQASSLPPLHRRNLAEAQKLMERMGWK